MNKRMIKKGDIFAINYASLHHWDKRCRYIEQDDGEDYTETDIIDLFDFKDDRDDYKKFLIVKYVGHGYVEEMLSGIKIRTMHMPNVFRFEDQDTIEEIGNEEGILELDTFKKFFNNRLNRFSKINKINMIKNLEYLQRTIKESPLVYLDDTDYVFELNDQIKIEYKKISDEERLKYLAEIIKKSSKSAEKCSEIINEAIEKTMKIEEVTAEKDSLEEQIDQFSKKNTNYKFRDYVQELSNFISKETLADDDRKRIEEEIKILKTVISQLQVKHGLSYTNENFQNDINSIGENKTFK